jgi:haloalkane dehalogenase
MTDELWRSEYPFQSNFMELADGNRLHYVDEGSGPPVLMVHGNPTWSFYYRHLVQSLQDRYRTIAVDHVGCGLSSKPQKYSYTLTQHIQNLTQLIEHLGLDGVHLVVHDWGGPIGLGMAGRFPEKIRSLTILNTGAFPPLYIPWRIFALRFPWLGSLAIRRFNLFAGPATRMTMNRTKLSDIAKAGLLAPYKGHANRVAIDAFVKDIPFSKSHHVYNELAQIERNLTHLADKPIQFIWGMQDWCFSPKCLSKFQELFPAANVLEIADAGHYVLEDAKEDVLAAISTFLDTTVSSVSTDIGE